MFMLCLIACGLFSFNESKHDYEWFHSSFNLIEARVAQIKDHTELILTEENQDEQRRLKMELSGMKQSCREMVANYNANSDKVNIGLFKGVTLPDHIDAELCE